MSTFNWYAFNSDLNAIRGNAGTSQAECKITRRRIASHKTLCEQLCNGFQTHDGQWDEQRTVAAERKLALLEARLTAFFGAKVVTFQHDPRGGTVKLQPKNKNITLVYFARDMGGDFIYTGGK